MQIWKDCKSQFKHELNEEEFSAWINPLDFTQYADDNGVQSFYVLAPNDFIKEHIRTNFDDKFSEYIHPTIVDKFNIQNLRLFGETYVELWATIGALAGIDNYSINTKFYSKTKNDKDS